MRGCCAAAFAAAPGLSLLPVEAGSQSAQRLPADRGAVRTQRDTDAVRWDRQD